MVLMALAALIGGVLLGLYGPAGTILDQLVIHSDWILYLLMFSVGISVGLHRGILQKIKEYHIKIFIIPFGVIVGSVMGGWITSLFLPIPTIQGVAVASGMGWYSLTGVVLAEMYGASMGSVAFLSNLMRDILSFFCIPWIARHLNYYTCIAPAGATSEDTTLSLMVRYTDEETVVLSVFNGIICSAVVPILIGFC